MMHRSCTFIVAGHESRSISPHGLNMACKKHTVACLCAFVHPKRNVVVSRVPNQVAVTVRWSLSP